ALDPVDRLAELLLRVLAPRLEERLGSHDLAHGVALDTLDDDGLEEESGRTLGLGRRREAHPQENQKERQETDAHREAPFKKTSKRSHAMGLQRNAGARAGTDAGRITQVFE